MTTKGWLISAALILGMGPLGTGCSQAAGGGAGPGFDGPGSDGPLADAGPGEPGSDPGAPSPVDAGAPEPIDLPEPPPAPAPEPEPEPVMEPHTCARGLTGEPGIRLMSMWHDGLLRTAIVHVPESYDPEAGTMVVLNFHGFTSADWQQALLTHMDREAEARGVIVAYPQGVAASWNAGDCCGTAWADAVDDVGFVEAFLDQLESEYCVDPRRVYATGMSNGGFISHRLACELSDRVAAVAPVAGVIGTDPAGCAPGRAVPVWQFHGTNDELVPYEGGTPVLHHLGANALVAFESVQGTLDHWAAVNGCTGADTITYAHGDVICVERQGCEAPTRLCTVHGGGHTWPGGLPIPFLGRTSRDIDATVAMLDFFEAHPMTTAPAR